MTRPWRWKLIIGALIALAAIAYGYQSMSPSWETITMVVKKKASNAMAALGEAWDATKSEVDDPIGHALGRLLANWP
ncbi:hypothetical protein [Pandoraea terrae]|nr:hypothetical protein [Pandoraea terrae]